MPGHYKLTGKYARIAEKMLAATADVLEKAGIPYILEAGTLLGVVRENRLLPWDDDVDITITRQHEKRLLKALPALWLRGYKVRLKYYTRDLKYFRKGEVRIIKVKHFTLPFFKSDVSLDIFLKRLIGDEYFWTVGVHRPVLKSVPRRFYEELGSLEFRGRRYSVPADYRGYLTEHYGDWQTVVREWNFKFDDRSVREKLYDEN